MRHLRPGYGNSDPVSMKEIRRIAIRAERTGKFNSLFRRLISYSFFMRRLPKVFMPPRKDVATVRKLSGKGLFRQILERLILLCSFRMEPSEYYISALFKPERYARAGEFLDYRQHSFLNFFLNQKKSTILTEDKLQFSKLCEKNGLRTAPIIARFDPLSPVPEYVLKEKIFQTAMSEGVFFKPRFGLQGHGAGRLLCKQHNIWSLTYAGGENIEKKWPEVFEAISKNCKEELIFQPLLKSHKEMSRFNPDSIQSARFITYRTHGQVQPLLARMRIGLNDSLVDASYASIGVPIDLQTKRLLRGGRKITAVLPSSIETFGPEKLKLEGFEVPYFEEMQALAMNVHEAFPEIFSLGHDILILDDGPLILETNHIWGNPQYAHMEGLGSFQTYIDAIIEIAKKEGI